MYRHTILLLALLGGGTHAGVAVAGDATVECVSHNYQYSECYAPLRSPQLVYQSSHSACIINRTWGFNPRTSRIWVNDGCSGVFADPGGYHHGQGGTSDAGARKYDQRGHDTGAVIAGALVGALLEGAVSSSGKKHSTSNNYAYTGRSGSGYTGCHGSGCLVDDPGYVADPPEPGQSQFSSPATYDPPPEPGQGSFSDDAPPEPGQTEMSSGSDDDN